MAIDEKKLIEESTWYPDKMFAVSASDHYRNGWNDCNRDWLKRFKELSFENKTSDKWVPCSERLPEYEGDYLVTCKGEHNRFVEIVQFRFGRFMICLDLCEVIAWYDEPLPKVYNGDR